MGNMDVKRKTSMKALTIGLLAILFFAACSGNHDYSPKPRGYYRIVFPKKEYRPYISNYPFTFLYPTYAVIELDKKKGQPKKLLNMQDLLNMQFPQFNGTLHLSYETITSKKVFDELVEDARKFAFKHTVKATSIDEGIIKYPDRKVYGIYYAIDGNAASSVQFYLTDSVHSYLRGALYFNSQPRLDSIQPVLNFVKKDVDVMIKSFRWKH
ncbi:MAG: gliding motility lipoprotein GldD [Mucilaginibacter sp.]|nr:gliding motility lipoprotein GldD [Mucilaginibacter sp.]